MYKLLISIYILNSQNNIFSSLGFTDGLDELNEMSLLILEEVELLLPLLGLNLLSLSVAFLDSLDLAFQFDHLVL